MGTNEAPAGVVGVGTGVGGWSSALGVDDTLVGAGGVSMQPVGRGGTGTEAGAGPAKEEPSVMGLDATSVGVSGVPTCPMGRGGVAAGTGMVPVRVDTRAWGKSGAAVLWGRGTNLC